MGEGEPVQGYDFLDFGASKGGSLKWAAATFGGVGLGLERNVGKLEILRAAGLPVLQGDATRLDLPDKCVRYSVMMDFLEHLPDAETGRRAIATAARVSRDFLYIVGPSFEGADYLRARGLKRYYADWHGHTWHHGVEELAGILKELSLRGCVLEKDRIRSAADVNLVPLDTPRDGGAYDPAVHGPKGTKGFDRPFFNRIVAIVPLADGIDTADILARSLGCRSVVA